MTLTDEQILDHWANTTSAIIAAGIVKDFARRIESAVLAGAGKPVDIHQMFQEAADEGEHMDDAACWERVAQQLARLHPAPTPEGMVQKIVATEGPAVIREAIRILTGETELRHAIIDELHGFANLIAAAPIGKGE